MSTELFIVQWARGKGSSPGRVDESSRAMLATARPSIVFYYTSWTFVMYLCCFCNQCATSAAMMIMMIMLMVMR